MRHRYFVLTPHGVIKIKSLSYTFEPTLIGKNEKQLNGFDDRIISPYSRELSTRDIQAHFKEVYGVDVSAGFISQVTNAVMDEVKRWQQRPLDAIYPIVYLNSIVVKSQNGGAVVNKSVYLALGVNSQGERAAGAMDSQNRGGQVLVICDDRTEKSWATGHLHRLLPWPERLF